MEAAKGCELQGNVAIIKWDTVWKQMSTSDLLEGRHNLARTTQEKNDDRKPLWGSWEGGESRTGNVYADKGSLQEQLGEGLLEFQPACHQVKWQLEDIEEVSLQPVITAASSMELA